MSQLRDINPNAEIVSKLIAPEIEKEVNGVEGMLYMSSTSSSDCQYKLTVTFEVGTDLDMAQVLVQNRVAIAQPRSSIRSQTASMSTRTSESGSAPNCHTDMSGVGCERTPSTASMAPRKPWVAACTLAPSRR